MILVHKKGEAENPANIRPITLESIPLKVITSLIRNRTFQFLTENNHIEQNIEKGFTPKLSGAIEHTAQLAHIINKAQTNTVRSHCNTVRSQKCIWRSSP